MRSVLRPTIPSTIIDILHNLKFKHLVSSDAVHKKLQHFCHYDLVIDKIEGPSEVVRGFRLFLVLLHSNG